MDEYIVIIFILIFVFIVIFVKINKRLKELLSMNNYLLKIIDSANEGIYVVDPQRKFILWNRSSEKISGYSKEDIIGKRCFDNILDHQDKNGKNLCQDLCPLAKSVKEGCSYGPEILYLKHKDGRRVPVEVMTGPIFDNSGNIIGGVEVFKDISDRLEKERLLIEKKQIEATVALAGAAAHELRQPLQAIIATGTVLKRKFADFCDAQECLNYIEMSCYRMNDIIKKMDNITSYKLKNYALNIKILDLEKSSPEKKDTLSN